MSSSSPPSGQHSGYASPAYPMPIVTPAAPTAGPSKPGYPSKSKPANVFSNDGSFLERFQRIKKEEDEKKQQDDMLAKKRNFDDRFKKRGKRPAESPSASSPAADDHPAKKSKSDKPMTQYEKEVKSYAGQSLKSDGIGIRPLVK